MLLDAQQFGAIPTVPYRLAFQQLVAECGKAMKLLGRGNIVKFGHDACEDFDVLQRLYEGFKTQNKKYQGILWDFVPLDDKLHPAIQAADVAAYVTFKFAQNYLENPSAENLRRLKRNMYKVVNWLDHPRSPVGGFDQETAPAKADYVI